MAFPSPAADYIEHRVSLDDACIKHPAATYIFRADKTLIRAGVFKDALIVVDSSIKPVHGSIVIADVDGRQLVRRLHVHPRVGLERLDSGDIQYMDVSDDADGDGISIFGVVMYCVNDMRTGEFDDSLVV